MAPSLHLQRDSEFHLASPLGLSFLALSSLCIYIIYLAYSVIYNVYFHPLRKFPGPKLWAASGIVYHIYSILGLRDERLRQFHNKYGEVVRYAPSALTFTTAQAWQDIYGHGHKQLPKYFKTVEGEHPSIITSNDLDHTRQRKALSHAFSEKALRDQEPLITSYIDLLIERLKGLATNAIKADMVKWYNFTTFDIIGDLNFGESFSCLDNSELHPWVQNLFHLLRNVPSNRMAQDYPIFNKIIRLFISKRTKEARRTQVTEVRKRTYKRLNNADQKDRPDFMDAMNKHKGDKDEMSFDEMAINAHVLILAGSETTATLLSGVTYWLLKNPRVYNKVKNEVRNAFSSESEINFISSTANLPYMLACLDEAFRMYPPVPTVLPRITLPNGPTTIAGYEVPPNISVGVHQSSAYWSPTNFLYPRSYIPERWIDQHSHTTTSTHTMTKSTRSEKTMANLITPGIDPDPAQFANDNKAVLQPFHVGPRNCIGRNLAYNEMRLILAKVLWNFELELCDESDDWANHKSYILWEKPALWCRLRLRDFDAEKKENQDEVLVEKVS